MIQRAKDCAFLAWSNALTDWSTV